MIRSKNFSRAPRSLAGFTLIELMITVSIMGMMAGMILFALYSAQETAKEAKSKSTIAKLDSIIKASWDAYLTRRTSIVINDEPSKNITFNDPAIGPIYIDPTKSFIDINGNGSADPGEFFDANGDGIQNNGEMGEFVDVNGDGNWTTFPAPTRARMQLDAVRDLMRLEHPDRWTDVTDPPVTPIQALFPANVIARPWVSQAYLRRYNAAKAINSNYPTGEFAGAECLYLIVMCAVAEDGDMRDLFRADEIKDTDGDGIPEFVDGWGQPIKFLRWPAGFQDSEFQIAATVTASGVGGGAATLTGASLNGQAGSYVGGAIYNLTSMSTQSPTKMSLDPSNVTRIVTYVPVVGALITTANITFTGGAGTIGGNVVVTHPDPYDPTRASNAATPPFALYPLIYSGGPNKCYGILAEFSSGGTYHYAVAGTSTVPFSVNPFKPNPDAVNGGTNSLMGNERDDPGEKNFVPSAWNDNIHNHMLNAR